MSKVITCINEKGGVGKSQIAFSVSWELAKRGHKVLLIDMDGQRANLTYMCGVEKYEDMTTMYNVLQRNKTPEKAIVNIKENLDIIPADNSLSDITQNSTMERAKTVISELKSKYDYIFIDVSPDPDWRQFLSLIMCEYAMIIMLPDMMSLEANNGILESYNQVSGINKNLKVVGILFNKDEKVSTMGKEVRRVADKYAKGMNSSVFNTTIRNAVVMGESAYAHEGITDYKGSSPVAQDIMSLVDELLERL